MPRNEAQTAANTVIQNISRTMHTDWWVGWVNEWMDGLVNGWRVRNKDKDKNTRVETEMLVAWCPTDSGLSMVNYVTQNVSTAIVTTLNVRDRIIRFNIVNIMGTDALAPCISRTLAPMTLTMWNKYVLVSYERGFQLTVSCQCSGKI